MERVQTGKRSDVPFAGQRAWTAFWRLDRRRQSNGYAANAISHSDVDRFLARNGLNLRAWELEALDAMETVRLKWLNRDPDGNKNATVSERQMSPELFDVIF